jgi:nitric-oxide synthase
MNDETFCIPSDKPRAAGCPHSGVGFDHACRWDLESALAMLERPPDGPAKVSLPDASRMAWREAVRCIGRLHWRSLQVVDARSLEDADSVYDACLEHLRRATRDGRIVPMQTVFAPWRGTEGGIRIWNHQLLRYAGYRGPDGLVLGDPQNVDFTRLVRSLGWSPPANPGSFDLLPLVIQAGGKLVVRDLPREAVLEVRLEHPEHPWFEELGLRWHAVPAVSDMMLVTRDEVFPCAPFNGWYMGTEIGARNLGDTGRYNMLPRIAEKLGLDQVRDRLWKDRALLVINEAVLHSFERDGVKVVDHHQASREFLTHCDREHEAGREVQAEWSWIVPPVSASATGVFHRLYPLRPRLPNLLLQVAAWNTPEGARLLKRFARP